MKIGAIIQARVGSTRLPGKVLRDMCGKSVLEHVTTRMKQSRYIDEIIIATTILDRDLAIVKEAEKIGVTVFRGSEDDVLARYYLAAEANKLDVIVRITSDCPLIDPQVVDEVIKDYLDKEAEIVTNAGSDLSQRTYPRGLDIEVLSFEVLENAYKNANEQYQREHVTPFVYENAREVFYHKNNIDYSKYRWTLDTEEDFEVIYKIYMNFYKGSHDFYLMDIVRLFEEKPDLYNINAHVEQKKLK